MEYQRIVLVREAEIEYEIEGSRDCAKLIEDVFKPYEQPEECVWLICLNTRGGVVALHEVSKGGLHATVIGASEVYKRALLNNAYGIILAHNHPSGDPKPSQEDITTTRKLAAAGELLGIQLVDHFVFGSDGWASMKEMKLF